MKLIILAIFLCISLIVNAQVTKTAIVTPGGLITTLTPTEFSTVTNLTLTGTLDARDFKTLRDNMPVLAVLDLSQINILGYSGPEGPDASASDYPANELPRNSFCKVTSNSAQGKSSLTLVILPTNITSIGSLALGGCYNLKGDLVIPGSVTSIGDFAFDGCFGIAGTLTLPAGLVSIGKGAFSGCSLMTGSLNIPATVTTIGKYAFSGCSRMKGTLTLPPNITSIADSAFSSCTQLSGNLSIPSGVTSIGNGAFGSCGGFTGSLVLPANLTSLGSYAFYGCGRFTGSVTIPSAINKIKDGTFAFMNGISSFVFPPVLTQIGNSAFESCSSWTGALSFPSTLTSIGNVAFESCSKLTGIALPNSLQSIGNSTFAGCVGLVGTFTIPNSVTTIGETAFQSCFGLTAVNLPSTLVTIPYGIFKYCTGLIGTFKLPESTTSIGLGAFAYCSALNSINIPNSVTAIGQAAFMQCTNLASIWAYRPNPVDLSAVSNVFDYVNKATCILYVPGGSKSAYQSASKWKDFTNITEMPYLSLSANTATVAANMDSKANVNISSNTSWTVSSDQIWLVASPNLGTGDQTLTFTAAANLFGTTRTATVTVTPSGLAPQTVVVTQMEKVQGVNVVNINAGGLFSALSADGLNTTFKLTVTGTIDARDFKTMRDSMPLLAEIDLSGATIVAYTGADGTSIELNNTYPANTIPESAFYNKNLVGKKTLRSIVLPPSATDIARYSFSNCTGLISIEIPFGYLSIGEQAFAGCANLSGTMKLPSSLMHIGYQAFTGCIGLDSFSIPSSVISIESPAFLNDPGLINVDPENPNYSSIEGVLFDKNFKTLLQCPNSKTGTFYIPYSVTTIGLAAFYNCKGIDSFVFPEGLMSINNYAFILCEGLTDAKLPEGLVSIGMKAFYSCSKLNSIFLPSTVKTIGTQVFQYCTSLNSITVNIREPVDLISSPGVFDGVNTSTCKLVVPIGSKSLYATSNQWKEFINISEMAEFRVSSTSAYIQATGGKASVDLNTTLGWFASSDQKWLTIDQSEGTGDKTFTFSATYNSSMEPRVAIVTVSALDVDPLTITITQQGNFSPVAYAGSDQTVNEGIVTTLDGSDSSDPYGNALTYKWTSPKGIILSSDTDSKPTFTAPQVKRDTPFIFSLVVNNGDVDSKADTVIVNVKNVSSLQDISLLAGWNIISANVIPVNIDLKDIFQPYIDSGNLKKVMDEAGKTIENFGIFGGWKNNIGNIKTTEGYKVNMTSTATLSLEGVLVTLPLDIPLQAGWNIISYPSTTAQNAMALVQKLIDAGSLIKVLDESGKTIENFGIFGGWKNNIGNFVPGKGYKVNVNTSCTLTIQANPSKAAVYVPEVLASSHFTKVFEGNGTDHMNVSLVDLQTSGLQTGDQIGVFDGKYCVGSATIGIEQLKSGNISIPVSANEGSGLSVNGFSTGNTIELQLYRGNISYKLHMETLAGDKSFEKNGSVFFKVSASDLPVIKVVNNDNLFTVYPNPFAVEITIGIQNSEKTDDDVAIYNLLGQRIKNLFKGTNKGQLLLKWDGTNESGQKVVPGVYLCKVNNNSKKVFFKNGK